MNDWAKRNGQATNIPNTPARSRGEIAAARQTIAFFRAFTGGNHLQTRSNSKPVDADPTVPSHMIKGGLFALLSAEKLVIEGFFLFAYN